MSGILGTEIVSPHATRKAATFGYAPYINLLASGEERDPDLMTGSQVVTFTRIEPEFPQDLAGSDARLREVSGQRLGDPGSPALTHRNLNSPVAVHIFGF
jgi:hypothetical protein